MTIAPTQHNKTCEIFSYHVTPLSQCVGIVLVFNECGGKNLQILNNLKTPTIEVLNGIVSQMGSCCEQH